MSRQICQQCFRPPKLCYCAQIKPINNQIKITIIQHPKESKHPFNTARIAHQCLTNSQLIVQEKLTQTDIENLLLTSSAILYPSMTWLPRVPSLKITIDENRSFQFDGDCSIKNQLQQLVILDATWRKSKRLMFLNPALQQLARVSLTGHLQSNYQIRKSTVENGLNSVESVYFALNALEPKNNFQNLLEVFDTMVSTQLGYQNSIEDLG